MEARESGEAARPKRAPSCNVLLAALRRPARVAVWLAAIAVAQSVISACGSGPPSLAAPGLHSAGAGFAHVRQAQAVSIGFEGTVCLDKPGSVTVTAITPNQAEGLRVIGFALRPNENWRPTPSPLGRGFLGMDPRPLRRLGFKAHIVDAVCDSKTGSGYEPAVRVVKTTQGRARTVGWTISYTRRGHPGTFQWPLTVDLCPRAC